MREETTTARTGNDSGWPARVREGDFRQLIAHPLRTWEGVQRWALLARYTGLYYSEVLRYRRELRANRELQSALLAGRTDAGYSFPDAAALYVMVRATRPAVVVETGVSGGFSSAHILAALAANDFGVLHSIDQPNVQDGSVLPDGRAPGWIVPHAIRGRWVLHFGDARDALPALLTSLRRVDVFLHDSDHSYEHMSFEYEHAFPALAAGGLLLSDDTHLHSAWDDFCGLHGLRANRVGNLGVTRKPLTQ